MARMLLYTDSVMQIRIEVVHKMQIILFCKQNSFIVG